MSASSFDHLRLPRRLWLLLVIGGCATLIFGYQGLQDYTQEHGPEGGHWAFDASVSLYSAAQMLILHTPHFEHGMNLKMHVACWSGAFTFFATALGLFWKRITREWRLFRLAFWWNGHCVVCGLGQKGMALVRSLKMRRPALQVVVIDPHPDERFLKECEALDVCVLTKDAGKTDVLEQAKVHLANEVIVITSEDETNVNIAMAVRNECAEKHSGKVECFVHLANINLRKCLREFGVNAQGYGAKCALNFFDVYDNEARRVLTSLPLDGAGISADDPHSVHVVILGFGRMGRSLAQRAAKMGHFANRKLLRISVIDRNANLQRERYLFRYPVLEKDHSQGAAICNLEFYEADAESITARKLVECWVGGCRVAQPGRVRDSSKAQLTLSLESRGMRPKLFVSG